jgi:hypothetical protein
MDMNSGPSDPYIGMSEDELRAEAAGYHGACYGPGEAGYCAPNHATWTYEPNYDISKLMHLVPEGWEAWFAKERQELSDLRPPGYYEAMLSQPIEEAIIVLERAFLGYIWDGWHRTGASITDKRRGIRAIVGRTGEDD